MTNTTYYNLNIAEGSDIVNPLTVDNPNYEKIDEVMHDNAVAGVTLATELTNATIHALTRENSDCSVIRFIATSNWKAGDSVTVDGVPVLASLPSGETLPDGAYVINANVLCVLTGTNLTVYVNKKNAVNASEIPYNDTNVGTELDNLNTSVQETKTSLQETETSLQEINSNLSNFCKPIDPNVFEELTLASREAYIPSKNGFLVIRVNGAGYSPTVGIWGDYEGNFMLTQQQVENTEADMTVCCPVKAGCSYYPTWYRANLISARLYY